MADRVGKKGGVGGDVDFAEEGRLLIARMGVDLQGVGRWVLLLPLHTFAFHCKFKSEHFPRGPMAELVAVLAGWC